MCDLLNVLSINNQNVQKVSNLVISQLLEHACFEKHTLKSHVVRIVLDQCDTSIACVVVPSKFSTHLKSIQLSTARTHLLWESCQV